METIPNHVMMMSGVRPDRSGVPANAVFDRLEGAVRDLDRPTDLRFPTVIERLNAAGYRTGTVLSKKYLHGIFGTRATYRWEPSPLVPVTNHAPDAFTTDALISMVDSVDPDLVFTNLGDIDRVGHSDLTARPPSRWPAPPPWPPPTSRWGGSCSTSRTPAGGRPPHSWSWQTTRWTGRCPPGSSPSPRPSTPTRSSPAVCRSRRTAAPTCSTGPAPTPTVPPR